MTPEVTAKVESLSKAVRASPDLQAAFMKCETLKDLAALAEKAKHQVSAEELVSYVRSLEKSTAWQAFFKKSGVDFGVYAAARLPAEQAIDDARAARFKKTATNAYCDSGTVISCFSCPTGVRMGCPLC